MTKFMRSSFNEKKQPIRYGILWERDALKIEAIEEKQIETNLAKSCKQLDITLEKVKISTQLVTITFLAKHTLNLSKVNTFLQKELKKQYTHMGMVPFIGITKADRPSKEDSRIQNLLSTIDEIAYYDLDEVCDEEQAFKSYIGDRPLTMIEIGQRLYLIDEEAISELIYLNCFECTKIHRYGCCCGSPCDMSEKNKRTFKRHEQKIEESLKATNLQAYHVLREQGGFLKKDGSINEYEGRCAMLVEEDGIYKCMTHKYALDNQMPIYDLCPLSCLMYPLEIMELVANYKTKAILLTSAIEESFASKFSRWGSYQKLDVDLRCLSQKAHNEQFRKENYKPVYEVNKGLLEHEFGSTLYKVLKEIVE